MIFIFGRNDWFCCFGVFLFVIEIEIIFIKFSVDFRFKIDTLKNREFFI